MSSTGSLTLVLGGVRSGKSAFAQSLAQRLGGDDVTFVATAEARDGEMNDRIRHHQQNRPAAWTTLEKPLETGLAIAQHIRTEANSPAVVLLDCLTLLVSNVMCESACDDSVQLESRVRHEVGSIVEVAAKFPTHVIIVSGEVGSGIVPEHSMGRLFRDLLGMANQSFSAVANQTYLMVAGHAIDVARLSTSVDRAAEQAVNAINIEVNS